MKFRAHKGAGILSQRGRRCFLLSPHRVGASQGGHSLTRENGPLGAAARTPHIPPRSARKATAPPRERKKEAALLPCADKTVI